MRGKLEGYAEGIATHCSRKAGIPYIVHEKMNEKKNEKKNAEKECYKTTGD